MLGNSRGESKFGCLVISIVLVVALFLTYKVGPVYFDKVSFEDEVTRIVNRAGADNWRDQTIRDAQLQPLGDPIAFSMAW